MTKIHEFIIHRILKIPSDFFLVLRCQKNSRWEEIFIERRGDSERRKEKSYYKNSIEKLHGRYTQYITLEGTYVQ